ncbi:MAG: iron ABC transporter ATP-binding protein [Leifsonia sp.]
MPRRLLPASAMLALPIVISIGLLTGCTTGDGGGETTATPTRSAEPTATAEPSATPTPTKAVGTPITIGCDELLTPDDIYAFNPNFGTTADYTPSSGTIVAEVAADNGLACGWTNQTSGEVIEVAVSQPAPDQLTAMKQAAAASMSAVPTYGTPPAVDGFFSQSGDIGTVEVFTATYALVARSSAFFEPGDAVKIIEPALSHLP